MNVNLYFLCKTKERKNRIYSDIFHLPSPLPMLIWVTRLPFIKLLSDM